VSLDRGRGAELAGSAVEVVMDYGILIGESVEIETTAAATVSAVKVSTAAMRSCQRVTSLALTRSPTVPIYTF
jgi:hypothetical protein